MKRRERGGGWEILETGRGDVSKMTGRRKNGEEETYEQTVAVAKKQLKNNKKNKKN